MTEPTIRLNELLASRLGLNPYGEGLFRWEFSEDLFWPEFPTGIMLQEPIMVPVIGGITCDRCEGSGLMYKPLTAGEEKIKCRDCDGSGKVYETEEWTVPKMQYRKEKMAPNLDRQWVITIWMPPESLGQWQANFPGAPYPARGQRIHTNASLPSYPGGPREPNLTETERFISLICHQRNHTIHEVARGIDDERTARDAAIKKEIEDEIRDDFPALMNIEPGKRGGYVSFPYSEKDRLQ